MKKSLFVGLFILAIMGMLAGPTFAAEPVVTWKVHTFTSPGPLLQNTIESWAENIFTMSNGRMKIEIFTPGPGEMPPDIFTAVQSGIRDAGYTTPAFVMQKYPASKLLRVRQPSLTYLVIAPGYMLLAAKSFSKKFMETPLKYFLSGLCGQR